MFICITCILLLQKQPSLACKLFFSESKQFCKYVAFSTAHLSICRWASTARDAKSETIFHENMQGTRPYQCPPTCRAVFPAD